MQLLAWRGEITTWNQLNLLPDSSCQHLEIQSLSFASDFTHALIIVTVTTLTIDYSFVLPLQDTNSPLLQILPIVYCLHTNCADFTDFMTAFQIFFSVLQFLYSFTNYYFYVAWFTKLVTCQLLIVRQSLEYLVESYRIVINYFILSLSLSVSLTCYRSPVPNLRISPTLSKNTVTFSLRLLGTSWMLWQQRLCRI